MCIVFHHHFLFHYLNLIYMYLHPHLCRHPFAHHHPSFPLFTLHLRSAHPTQCDIWWAASPLHRRLEAGVAAPGWEWNALNWNICQAADYMIAASPTRSGGCLKNQKHSPGPSSAAEEPRRSYAGDIVMKCLRFPPSTLQNNSSFTPAD